MCLRKGPRVGARVSVCASRVVMCSAFIRRATLNQRPYTCPAHSPHLISVHNHCSCCSCGIAAATRQQRRHTPRRRQRQALALKLSRFQASSLASADAHRPQSSHMVLTFLVLTVTSGVLLVSPFELSVLNLSLFVVSAMPPAMCILVLFLHSAYCSLANPSTASPVSPFSCAAVCIRVLSLPVAEVRSIPSPASSTLSLAYRSP
jgi:hypothetical protein